VGGAEEQFVGVEVGQPVLEPPANEFDDAGSDGNQIARYHDRLIEGPFALP
jgi:hypothetical protein